MISKPIHVVDYDDGILAPTYPRRARQLVKKQRALWVSEDTIRMTRLYREETCMDTLHTETPDLAVAVGNEPPAEEKPTPEDKDVLDLARRRRAVKKNLLGQLFDFLLILFCMFLLVVAYDSWDRAAIVFLFCLFWGIRLSVRTFKFVKPSFKDGIVAYLKEREAQKLEAEYNRLKKMGPDYVVSELGRSV